jgi:hypothetical protein
MPAERVAMRQVREIIRLKFSAGISTREIARRLGIAASTARETLRRFEGAGLGWPLPDGMSDGDLEAALYANHGTKRGHRRHAEPDWPTVHRELKRKHVTLVIVWDACCVRSQEGDRARNLVGRTPAIEHRVRGVELVHVGSLLEWFDRRGLGDAGAQWR